MMYFLHILLSVSSSHSMRFAAISALLGPGHILHKGCSISGFSLMSNVMMLP